MAVVHALKLVFRLQRLILDRHVCVIDSHEWCFDIRNIGINIMGRYITNVMDVASRMAVVHTVRLAPPPVVGVDYVDPVPTIYCPLTCCYNQSEPAVVAGHN